MFFKVLTIYFRLFLASPMMTNFSLGITLQTLLFVSVGERRIFPFVSIYFRKCGIIKFWKSKVSCRESTVSFPRLPGIQTRCFADARQPCKTNLKPRCPAVFTRIRYLFCNRNLLNPLPGIYFYTPYLLGTYFVIESCLSLQPGIYFYTPQLPGTYFAVKRFRTCALQLPGIEVLDLSLPAAGNVDTAFMKSIQSNMFKRPPL